MRKEGVYFKIDVIIQIHVKYTYFSNDYIAHVHVTIAHVHVTIDHAHVIIAHVRVTIAHVYVTIGHTLSLIHI